MIIKEIITISTIVVLAGCAIHQAVITDTTSNKSLSCQQINDEIKKSQEIVDEVNNDKAEAGKKEKVGGPDTITWYFPLNLVPKLIAKYSNSNDVLIEENQKIIRLNSLKQEKSCPVNSESSVSKVEK